MPPSLNGIWPHSEKMKNSSVNVSNLFVLLFNWMLVSFSVSLFFKKINFFFRERAAGRGRGKESPLYPCGVGSSM